MLLVKRTLEFKAAKIMVNEAMALRASPVAFRFEPTVTLEWVRQQIVQFADECGWSSEVAFVLIYVAICYCLCLRLTSLLRYLRMCRSTRRATCSLR